MTTIPNVRETFDPYFGDFLATKMKQPLLPKLHKLSVTFTIELLDATRPAWTLAIENGMLVSIANEAKSAQCGFKLNAETFAAIASGTTAPQIAFFKRQVEIEGDIVLGLKLATVLAEFFKRFPWTAAKKER